MTDACTLIRAAHINRLAADMDTGYLDSFKLSGASFKESGPGIAARASVRQKAVESADGRCS
jgi:hypothetical protein